MESHPQTPISETTQPADSDLEAIAQLSTTAFGRALLALANAGALRTAAQLGAVSPNATGVLVQNTAPADVPLVLKGAASQSTNMQEWRSSADSLLAAVHQNGEFKVPFVMDVNANGPYVQMNSGNVSVINRTTVSNIALIVKGMASQTGNLQEWQSDSATVLARVSPNGTISASGSGVLTPYVQTPGGGGAFLGMDGSTVRVENATTASNVALTVKGMSSQSGDLTQWKDSAGTLMARITAAGNYYGPAVGDVSQTGPYISMATTSMTVFNRTTASNVPLVVKGMASQSGALTQWQDSAGVVLAQVSSSGSFYLPVVQAAAGTGPYAGLDGSSVTIYNRTTASNVPLVVRGMASQAGNLQQWQDSTGTVLTRIAGNGSVRAPFLEATGGTEAYVQMANSVLVINRNTVTNVPLVVRGMASQTGNLQEWQDSAGVVTAFVSSVGGVAATGGIIAPYMVNATNTETYIALTGGSVLLQNRNTVGNKPLIVQGMASQSGNLTEWQDSTGSVLGFIRSDGVLSFTTLQGAANSGPYMTMNGSAVQVFNRTTAGNVPLIVKGMASQTGNLQEWQDSAGTTLAWVSSSGGIATNGGFVSTSLASASSGYPYIAMNSTNVSIINRTAASNVPLIVKGMAAQTGALQEWQDSSGTSVGSIWADGSTRLPALQANGAGSYPYLSITASGFLLINRNNAANVPLTVKGMASQTGHLVDFKDSNDNIVGYVTSGGGIYAAGSSYLPSIQDTSVTGPYLNTGANSWTLTNRTTASNVPLIIKGMAGQTGNLLEVQASDTAALASITSAGSINAVGNLRVGTFGIGTGGSKVIEIANASVVPSANPTGGGVLYVEGGALKYRGSSGTITTIAPA